MKAKRARTAEQDDEPTAAVAEWDLSTFRREFTRVSGRAGWIRRVCERLDVSRGSRNARQYAAEKAIDLRAGFDQAVENSKRPLQEGDM